jgi:hypothetical protein
VRVEAEAGARALPSEFAEARGALGVSVWPHVFDERLGFGASVSTGPGAHAVTAAVDAHLTDVSASASVRSHILLGSRVAIEPALGGTAHWITVEGFAPDDGAFHSLHVDASIDAAIAVEVRFGALAVGVRAVIGYVLRNQRYLVDETPVLAPTPFIADALLRVSAGAF